MRFLLLLLLAPRDCLGVRVRLGEEHRAHSERKEGVNANREGREQRGVRPKDAVRTEREPSVARRIIQRAANRRADERSETPRDGGDRVALRLVRLVAHYLGNHRLRDEDVAVRQAVDKTEYDRDVDVWAETKENHNDATENEPALQRRLAAVLVA